MSTTLGEIMLPQPFLKAFPEPETVFCDPVERYARHMNPLVSIDLSAVDPSLSGWVHLVSPIEPCDGYLGDQGSEYWGGYLQANWIGFRLNQDNRYELLGDFRFFGVENSGGKEFYRGARADLIEMYPREHASYLHRKHAFAETGQINLIGSDQKLREVPALTELGGRAPTCNIVWNDSPTAAFTYAEEDGAPRTRDGRLYSFIAAVPGHWYRDNGADRVILYFDPVERIVLQTFVFT